MKGRMLVLLPYPQGHAASQRFRIEHYLPLLKEQGWDLTLSSFLDEGTWSILYQPGRYSQKVFGFLKGFFRRYRLLFGLRRYDIIWVHREATPVGLPLYPWLITHLGKRRVIYEFDDAVWMPNVSESNRRWSFLKPYGNAKKLIRWSWKNAAGNEWLRNFASGLNSESYLLPTVVDTENGHRFLQDQETKEPVIGWTGSHSTLPYLQAIVPILRELQQETPFRFVVICDEAPSFELERLEYIPWSASSEAEDLLKMHIGIMPLPDEEWVNGKCGFKLIQYMSQGIVPVADDRGVNGQIIDHGVNGLLCKNQDDWKNHLRDLLKVHQLRQRLASNCRSKIEEAFSVKSQRDKFLHLLEQNDQT